MVEWTGRPWSVTGLGGGAGPAAAQQGHHDGCAEQGDGDQADSVRPGVDDADHPEGGVGEQGAADQPESAPVVPVGGPAPPTHQRTDPSATAAAAAIGSSTQSPWVKAGCRAPPNGKISAMKPKTATAP